MVLAVTSPVRWIERLMRDDGAPSTAVADDPEQTFVERVSLRIPAIGWLSAAIGMAISVADDSTTSSTRAVGLTVLSVSAIDVVAAVFTGRSRTLATIRP